MGLYKIASTLCHLVLCQKRFREISWSSSSSHLCRFFLLLFRSVCYSPVGRDPPSIPSQKTKKIPQHQTSAGNKENFGLAMLPGWPLADLKAAIRHRSRSCTVRGTEVLGVLTSKIEGQKSCEIASKTNSFLRRCW